MRDFKGMKRQRGRNRGGGGPPIGGKPQQNANRAFDSTGPENIKVRGHAQSVYEKYQQLARDAFTSGDRVLAEGHLQHAEHYFRLLRLIQPNRPTSEIVARDVFASGVDIDFEDESGAEALPDVEPTPDGGIEGQAEPGPEAREDGGEGGRDRPRYEDRGDRNARDRFANDRPQSDRPQSDRPQSDRIQNDRYQNDRQGYDRGDRYQPDRGQDRPQADRYERQNGRGQGDRWQADRPQTERPQADRAQNSGGVQGDRYDRDRPRNRDDRPREDRFRDDRPRDDRPREDRAARDDRPREDRPPREDRYRDDRPRTERFERQDRPERSERDDRLVTDPSVASAVAEFPAAAPVFAPSEEREGPAAQLRSEDGGISEAPAFLQAGLSPPAAVPGEDGAPARRPRRPRRRATEERTDEGAEPVADRTAEDA